MSKYTHLVSFKYFFTRTKGTCTNREIKSLELRIKYVLLVGMTGFEPAAPSSRTKCATGLRYIPNKYKEI